MDVTTLDYVPFQFFLSIPKNEKDDLGWLGLIIFSNYYSIGYENSVVGFYTQNIALCKGLKTMYCKLLDSQDKKDKNPTIIKKIFYQCGEINITLKNIDIKEQEVVKLIGFNFVTPVPDILAKDFILVLLKEFDIKYNPAAWYICEGSKKMVEIAAGKNIQKSYFSVGLFYNPLTIYLSQTSPTEGNPLFKLVQKKTAEGKNKIMVANGGTTENPSYLEFEESFKEESFKDEVVDSCDYSIFCKLKIKESWFFVGGGINYFGSRYVHECLKYCVPEKITDIVDKPFILVFKLQRHFNLDSDNNDLQKKQINKTTAHSSLIHCAFVKDDEILKLELADK